MAGFGLLPGETNTSPLGINDRGQIVGTYVGADHAQHEVLLSASAAMTEIDDTEVRRSPVHADRAPGASRERGPCTCTRPPQRGRRRARPRSVPPCSAW